LHIFISAGVILTQEATEPLENVGESDHQLNDIHVAGSQEYVKNPPSSPPPLTSSFPSWPTTDETLYKTVSNALDGILRLDNLNWSNDLSDTKSRVYRQVSAEIEKHLGYVLRHMDDPPVIKVYDINKNGEVKFRISYPPLDTVEKNQEYIEKALQQESNMIGQYHLNRLQVKKLVDQCEHGNLGCTENCIYDYYMNTFTCICRPGKTLAGDGKTCVDDNDLSNVEMDDIMPQTSTELIHDFVQGRSRDPNTMHFEPRHPNTWESPDFKTGSAETDMSTSKPIIEQIDPQFEEHNEPMSTTKNTHVFEHDDFHWNNEHFDQNSVKISSTEESTVPSFIMPVTEPKFTIELESTIKPESSAEPAVEAESTIKIEPIIEPEPTAEPEPVLESEPTVKIEPVVEPEPAIEPTEPTAESESITKPGLTIESTIKPELIEPESAAEPESIAKPESVAEPESTVEPEPTIITEPIASTESPAQTDFIIPDHRLESTTIVSEPKLIFEQEPTAEPHSTAEPKPIIESTEFTTEIISSMRPVTVVEPIAIPELATTSEIGNNIKSDMESDYLSTTDSYMEANTKMSVSQSESTKPFNENIESSTRISFSDGDTTEIHPSITDSINEYNDLKNIPFPTTTTVKFNENQMDNGISLQVIPLIPKNDSIIMNDNVEIKTDSTTMQLYSSNDDKLDESKTNETDFTTSNYENLKQDSNENVTLIKSKNNEELNTSIGQSMQSPIFQQSKNTDSDVKTNLDTNIQNESPLTDEHDIITEQPSSTNANISEEPDSVTITSFIPMEDKTDLTTRLTPNNRHFHTIEINGINMNSEMHNKPKVYETTMLPEITSPDVFSQAISGRQEELQPTLQSESDMQKSNEKNVIEHMPTTIFPKVSENFAHNVEPLKEPIMKSVDDEHIMLISKSKQSIELHSIIPELIPEQRSQNTNETLISMAKIDNETINKNLNVKKSANDTVSSTEYTDENTVHKNNNEYIIRPDEAQEHSTSHPLHPVIFPENSVDHFAGKSDTNDDRHIEDMSPFLPDVHKEKESTKKAPRLDKDEQDVPNPFETHIEDVITHRPLIDTNNAKHEVNETETKDLLNDVNSHSPSDEEKMDTTNVEENHKTNIINNIDSSAKDTTKNDLDITKIINDTESKIQDMLHQDGDSAKADGISEDIMDKKNNTSFEENNEALKVIPLIVEDKSMDSSSMQSTNNKTADESAEVTIPIMKKAEEEIGIAKSHVNSSEKPEENAVEDHYNDISDETLSKGYDHIGKDIPVKIIDESKKAIFKNIDPERVLYKDAPPSQMPFDVIKEKDRPNKEILFDITQAPVITKMEGFLDNQTEITKPTTQEPVLPMEIQQEMSTTVATDEMTTMIHDGKREENNTESPNVAQFEKEVITTAQITTQSTLETVRTTAQVPILPEELQTMEMTDALTTTSSMPIETKQAVINKTEPETSTEINDETKKNETNEKENAVIHSVEADINETSSEKNIMATSVHESNMNMEFDQKIEYDKDERNRTTMESSTESIKMQTTPMTSTIEHNVTSNMEKTSTMSSDIITTEDVRPVTEIIDDTPMIEFDYRTLFPTTTMKQLLIQDPDELPEEALTVIPLEKNQENKKKPADKKGFDKYKYKKEKDLILEDQNKENGLTESPNPTTLFQTELSKTVTVRNYEELNDSAVSSDIDSNVPRFVLADTKGNILPISKLKNIAHIDNNKSVETRGTTTEMKNKTYPSFIPVSEEIIDSAVTEPYTMMKNYTYYPIIISDLNNKQQRITIANETLSKDLTNSPETDSSHVTARTNDMIKQSTVPSTDQSFNNAEETKMDSVTKEPIIETTPLNIDVESVTIAIANSSKEPNTTSNTIVYSKCNAGQFQCINGTSRDGAYCVSLSAKCDSENDCSDGSDEINCEAEGCPGNFRCASGQCLKRHLVCNKIMDCDDGSDERDCDNWKCQSDEFSCPNGKEHKNKRYA